MTEVVWLAIVIPARYGGSYEGAPFVAFYVDPDYGQIPEEAIGNDVEARNWWHFHSELVGRGVTPNDALIDLGRRFPDARELAETVQVVTGERDVPWMHRKGCQ